MSIKCKAYPRAGLIGNPSDGYFGKTIAFTFDQFCAEVELVDGGTGDVRDMALLQAADRKFREYCRARGRALTGRVYSLRHRTNIPRQVGLAGSSALIIAALRVLMTYHAVEIPKPELSNLALAVETEELGIPGGLQDRVAQVYEGLVFMDFDRALMERTGSGRYEALDPALLPPLYIAYRTDLSESSEVFHSDLRARWERGEPDVVEAMRTWAGFADQARDLLLRGEGRKIGPLLNANFDLRRRLCRISEGNIRLVETARSTGASAKFAGSGGAIVGTYDGEAMYDMLCEKLEAIKAHIFKPRAVETI